MRIAVFLLLFVIQMAWSDLLRIGPIAPDLLFVALVWLCAARSGSSAALLGFLAGLCLDLSAGLEPFGASALAGTSAAFFASRFLSPQRKLHPFRLMGRAFVIVAPLELFLANLRYEGLDYLPAEIALYQALPVTAYTLGLLGLLFFLPVFRNQGTAS